MAQAAHHYRDLSSLPYWQKDTTQSLRLWRHRQFAKRPCFSVIATAGALR
ncbi:hypothetical protein ACLB1E_16340 [Escherichia coli]